MGNILSGIISFLFEMYFFCFSQCLGLYFGTFMTTVLIFGKIPVAVNWVQAILAFGDLDGLPGSVHYSKVYGISRRALLLVLMVYVY